MGYTLTNPYMHMKKSLFSFVLSALLFSASAQVPADAKIVAACGGLNYVKPNNFNFGSMGNYLTYTEILAELDAMAAQYPAIFKLKAPIHNFQTHEGRPIHWVKISDNAATDENEPRVLYHSLMHANEPMSTMQLIFYMWYVLENYNTQAEIKYLVDNCEMYFVPVANPDGYVYNQTLAPNGGGMHSKNKRPGNTFNPGVDLNRNFGHQWGTIPSTNDSDDTYQGPSAFSEPETQALKWLAEQYDFTVALSHHAHGNLILRPYGYDSLETADSTLFRELAGEMGTENGFSDMICYNSYPHSGGADDWLYTATPNKPKVYALDVETGYSHDGFWPAANRIIPICKANIKLNLDAARFVLNHGVAQSFGNTHVPPDAAENRVSFGFKRLGLENGNFTVSLESLSPQAAVTGTPIVYNSPAQFALHEDWITYLITPGTPVGTELKFNLVTDNGTIQTKETVVRVYGYEIAKLEDGGNDLANWTGTNWGIQSHDSLAPEYVTQPSFITDSPSGNSQADTTTYIISKKDYNITAPNALIRFWAKWDIEEGYDYVQFEASVNNGAWTPLCGKYTKPGAVNQNGAENRPVFSGKQSDWVMEEISLRDYVNKQHVKFRFKIRCDAGTEGDGFCFDDFALQFYADSLPVVSVDENEMMAANIYPNPASGSIFVSEQKQDTQVRIFDATGKTVYQNLFAPAPSLRVDIAALHNGLYFMELASKKGKKVFKIVVKQ